MTSNQLLGASWCAPCNATKLFLDNRGITYDYIDIDTDEGMELAATHNIKGIPAMVITSKDGITVLRGEKSIKEAFDE